MEYPSAIIFINLDLTDSVKEYIKNQLFITSEMSGPDFDLAVNSDSEFIESVKAQGGRMLVVRDLHDLSNRNLADIVLFFSKGLLYVEDNKFGPPGQTYKAATINPGKLFQNT